MADLSTQHPWWARICIAMGVAGIGLIIVGLSWSILATPSAVWSREQAAELKAAYDALHIARSGIGDRGLVDGDPDPRYVAAAQARLDRINAALERAQSVKDDWGKWAAFLGLAVMVASGLGFVTAQGKPT